MMRLLAVGTSYLAPIVGWADKGSPTSIAYHGTNPLFLPLFDVGFSPASQPTALGKQKTRKYQSPGFYFINNYNYDHNFASTSATVCPISDGVGQIVTPSSFSIATFSAALSPAEEMIAPAWPMRRPSGAVSPAM
ncbi:hypothetical protein SAMN05216334_11258 [Nitrosomonas ureae]|uniref:Uncharacterized protein n=1 Tax=Nitrosomonas ureae TaxID=44577 RepID=A0A1H5VEN3_9PROT|nr:hypothetical protein SAMN05216334_11258 [Nitrosomonas ureae]